MINKEVAERLLANLEFKPINHDQRNWLTDHGTLFVISEKDRWSCATSGCAAGFVFLEEGTDGMVFNTISGEVYPSIEAADEDLKGTNIDKWAAEKLGLDWNELHFLFYSFEDTEGTIKRIKFLMAGGNPRDYPLDRDGKPK